MPDQSQKPTSKRSVLPLDMRASTPYDTPYVAHVAVTMNIPLRALTLDAAWDELNAMELPEMAARAETYNWPDDALEYDVDRWDYPTDED